MENILITGGTGLVGQKLTAMLQAAGYSISYLSRSRKKRQGDIQYYRWDVARGELDDEAIGNADHVINLAGASIAGGRWTAKRKEEIYTSRVAGTMLFGRKLRNTPNKVQTFVSASAVGYYGDAGENWLTEESPSGSGFLAGVCRDWEAQSNGIAACGIRTVILRIGIVLSRDGGALPELERSMRFGVATYLGSGRQYYSWIHIDDLCRMFMHVIQNKQTQGAYNAVAPAPVTNKALVQEIRREKGSLSLMAAAPAFALKVAMGEMSAMVLESQRCASARIEKTGFHFKYAALKDALKELYH